MTSILEERELAPSEMRAIRHRIDATITRVQEIPWCPLWKVPDSLRRERLLMRINALEARLSETPDRYRKFLSLAILHRDFSLPERKGKCRR